MENYEALKEILDDYYEVFGEKPIFTGGSFFDHDRLIDELEKAINNRVPFKDISVEEGTLI